jgi:hypothetical protein
MNLDLLTQDQLKTYYTNRWCVEHGIKSRDILNHPQIDDAILLINIREEFWKFLNAQDRGIWAAYWKKVYHLQFPLNKKSLKKLEKISNNGIYWQSQAQLKIQTIKALRESKQNLKMTSS